MNFIPLSTVVLRLALCAAVLATGIQCSGPRPNPHSGPEARQWLAENGNPYALASNRFDSTKDALAFVESLYEAGATKVSIVSESISQSEGDLADGGPYADAIVVEFDPAQADKLVPILQREVETQGAGDPFVVRNGWALLWWD